MKEPTVTTWLTVADVAETLRVNATKVGGWIARGELAAADVSSRSGGKPRWRISPDALEAFLLRRAAPDAPPVRKRRKRNPEVIEFV
jgi:excisionase family DNA binding protein